jgi:hypothetical protein
MPRVAVVAINKVARLDINGTAPSASILCKCATEPADVSFDNTPG